MSTSDSFLPAITALEARLKEQLLAVAETKRAINTLSKIAELQPPYPDAESEGRTQETRIRSDQFYGQPLATAVKDVLKIRKQLNHGPATVSEIYDMLRKGGYAFETQNEDNAKRNLRTSLSKNQAFHALPGQEPRRFGLLEWYPAAKQLRSKNEKEEENEDPDMDSADDQGSANAEGDLVKD